MRRASFAIGLVLIALAVTPLLASATHREVPESERTPFKLFAADMETWLGHWLHDPEADLLEGVAGLSGWAVADALADISPQACYREAYMRFWIVQADMWHMGQGPTPDHKEAARDLFFQDLARAAEAMDVAAIQCHTDPDAESFREPGQPRVIEIEATPSLQFSTDGERMDDIPVVPGEVVVFRIDNTSDFEHSFYIGTERELMEPMGTTANGIPIWSHGIRELEWTVPDDVSGLMFGCTVPGHYGADMHGTFTAAST